MARARMRLGSPNCMRAPCAVDFLSQAPPHATVYVYTLKSCGFCKKAKALLQSKGWSYTSICLSTYPEMRDDMFSLAKSLTVPQVFFDGTHVGRPRNPPARRPARLPLGAAPGYLPPPGHATPFLGTPHPRTRSAGCGGGG